MKFNVAAALLTSSFTLVPACGGYPHASTTEIRNTTIRRRGRGADLGHLRSPPPRQGLPRPVWIAVDVRKNHGVMDPDRGPVSVTHAQIALGGTAYDAAMNVQIYSPDSTAGRLALRASYASRPNTLRDVPFVSPESWDRTLKRLEVETTLTNEELLDPMTGMGLIVEIWGRDPVVQIGGFPEVRYNGALNFVEDLLRHPSFFRRPGWKLDPKLADMLAKGKSYWERQEIRVTKHVNLIYTHPHPDRYYEFELRYPRPSVFRASFSRVEEDGYFTMDQPPAFAVDRDFPPQGDGPLKEDSAWGGSPWSSDGEDG